jgi:hypothetical protein
MHVSATIIAFLAAASMTVSPVFAGPAGKPAKPIKPTSVAKPTSVVKPTAGSKPTTIGKPTTVAKPVAHTTTHHATGKPTKSAAIKPTTSGKATKSAPVKHTAVKSSATKTSGSKPKAKSTSASIYPAPSSSPTATTPLNPIAEKIASKPNLSAKLTRMLPVDPTTGTTMTLDKASLGFKNQGQFIAALHVSQNLGIPFTELKSHMVTVTPGTAGAPPTATQTGSLGQAIQASKATADAPTAVVRAESQADADLRTLTSTTAGSSSTGAKPKKTTSGGSR